ncbi:MAG: NAD(P)-binding protein, partial [Bdellovibrionales bacterium]|nr:NAD(P)-binding protein [Bdellovibrionales bacterium]
MNDIPTDVLIIGAGPAGITAGVELLRRSSLKVSIVEASSQIGGISTTADQNGNLMDLGGHRFFSKSKRVMDWWFSVLPLYIDSSITSDTIAYQGKQLGLDLAQIPITNDEQISSFRIRPRTSRILFRNHLLPYPLQLSSDLLHAMGVLDTFKAAIGLVRSKLAPIRPEITLEDFFINRFGRCLYQIFFEEYSEKVWGKPCRELSAEWGAQRVKGVSIIKALKSSLEGLLPKSAFSRAFESRVETSLIEQFLYPTRGPGELWQCAMTEFLNRGGKLVSPYCVSKITPLDQGRYRVTGTSHEGENISWVTPTIISSMPITDFFAAWDGPVEESTREIATNLQYRDFIVVGLL